MNLARKFDAPRTDAPVEDRSAEVPALVGFVLRTWKHDPDDYEDLKQEGVLAGLQAARTYDPTKGPFANHITTRVRYALRDYQRREQSVVRGASYSDAELDAPSNDDPEDTDAAIVDRLTYGDSAPHGFGDPGETIQRELAAQEVDRLLALAPQRTADVLRATYGIGRPRETFRQISERTGLAVKTVHNIMRAGERFLAQMQKAPDYGHTHPGDEGSGDGAVRRSHEPANRSPGFWNGAVNDSDAVALPESIGRVYGDWSWKPSAEDLARGCKP